MICTWILHLMQFILLHFMVQSNLSLSSPWPLSSSRWSLLLSVCKTEMGLSCYILHLRIMLALTVSEDTNVFHISRRKDLAINMWWSEYFDFTDLKSSQTNQCFCKNQLAMAWSANLEGKIMYFAYRAVPGKNCKAPTSVTDLCNKYWH